MKVYRAGIVGVGFIGAVHIEQLRRLGNVEVVAITDSVNAQGKADSLMVPKGYGDFKEMIDNERLDCVHICTPNNTHHEIAMYAMKRGVNVVCEKPMTCTLAEAEELCRVAGENRVVNAMNFNCRFYPMAFQLREMVRAGDLGDIFTIHGGYLQDWLFYNSDYNWRLESDSAGKSRAFSDIGSHWIDLVEFVTGARVTELLADFAIFHKTRKKPLKPIDTYSGMALSPEDYEDMVITTEDYASVLFHLDTGAHANCIISQVYAGRKNQMLLSVAGSKCSVEWDTENTNHLWIGNRSKNNEQMVKDPSILSPGARDISSYPGGHGEGFPDSFKQNFKKIYEAISKNDPISYDFATFNDGLREMLISEKIVQSANEKRWIAV